MTQFKEENNINSNWFKNNQLEQAKKVLEKAKEINKPIKYLLKK